MKQLVVFTIFLFFLSAVNGHGDESKKVYPLSISAARSCVTKWLESNRYGYTLLFEPIGVVSIRGTDQENRWHIRLQQKSPLATLIVVSSDGDDPYREKFEQLLQKLANKENGEDSSAAEQVKIPSVVLDRIGTVACIQARTGEQVVQFSGVFIDSDGLILSTAHDLREHEEVSIVSTIGTSFQGDIIKTDFIRDLALIKIKAEQDQVVSLEEGRNLIGMGEKIYSIGCPIGLRGTVSAGFINGPPRTVENQPLWQASLEIQPGSSGSPVFDGNGTIVGLIKARHRVSPDIGFIIPLEVIIDFLGEQLEQ